MIDYLIYFFIRNTIRSLHIDSNMSITPNNEIKQFLQQLKNITTHNNYLQKSVLSNIAGIS